MKPSQLLVQSLSKSDDVKWYVDAVARCVASRPGAKRGALLKDWQNDITLPPEMRSRTAITFYRWMEAAIEAGLITREGNTAAAVYYPTERLTRRYVLEHLAKPSAERQPVPYNFDMLRNYRPNFSRYLTAEDIRRLEKRCKVGALPLNKISDGELRMWMTEVAFACSKLEGSDWSMADTMALDAYEQEVSKSDPRNAHLARNHYNAVKWQLQSIKDDGPMEINIFNLSVTHAILSAHLLKDEHVGRLRDSSRLLIHESSYSPLTIGSQVRDAMEMLVSKAERIKNPYEASFFLLVHLSYLQGFMDCNKRTARMAANIPLLNSGISPISWIEASKRSKDYMSSMVAVYELNDLTLAREIFVDSFMRSAERFDLLKRERQPSSISNIYYEETKRCVREFVNTGILPEPRNVSPDDISAFKEHVDEALRGLAINPMLAHTWGIPHPVAVRWAAEQQALVNQGQTVSENETRARERSRG